MPIQAAEVFQYLMKLHYSQTAFVSANQVLTISVPYEITLLSNVSRTFGSFFFISVPYEITLLSNVVPPHINTESISVPYEITLLSNRPSPLEVL